MPASQRTLERRIRAVYTEAQKDLQKKLDDYIVKFRAKDAQMRQDLAEQAITKKEYDQWRQGAIFQGKAWRARLKQVTDTLANANEESLRLVRGEQLNEFAEGMNHEQFVLAQNTGLSINFGIYDAETVGKLIREQPDLLPPKKLNRGKDSAWNQKKVTGSVLQGIIQGESIDDIAKRIARDTAQQNSKAMIRYARTATTGAQNAGRMETIHRAKGMGINVRKQWLATLDGRTRDSHRHLDGQVKDIDDPFDSDYGKIMFPGDPSAHPGDVYNCRCTLVYVYPDYPEEDSERLDNITGEHVRGDVTYDEWKAGKTKAGSRVAQGTDITGTWKRREGKFITEIEDVINAQGFDGLPRVVSQEEFDRAVKESGLYAQRVYSAQTEEALEAYRKELYGGKFYVDCSVGGADFGQGMYMSGDFTGKKIKDVMEDSDRYVAISESRGNKHSFVEKMTLDKDSKIATYDSLLKEYQTESVSIQNSITSNLGHKLVEYAVNKYGLNNDDRNFLLWGLNIPKEIEPFDVMKASKYSGDKKTINSIRNEISSKIKAEKSANPIISANGDMGIYGAMKGYDAINIEGQAANGTSQVLVLNRTKLIIRRAK